MTNWRSNTGIRSGVPITPLGSGRQSFGKPGNGFPSSLFTKRNVLIALIVFSFLIIFAIGRSSNSEKIEEEQGLAATVQESMVRSGLSSVQIKIIDSTVVLEGTIATQELKEAATRVAQAQVGVISVENMLEVPVIVNQVTTTTTPNLPASQKDLLLQTRLSAAGASSGIQFESGGDVLTLESIPTLERLAYFLNNEKEINVQILGHTDSDEKCPGDNLILSQRRAEAVRAQLLARGIEAERLISTGMGHTDPIADNLSKAGKAANRRIEFLLITEEQNEIPPPAQPETVDGC
ncbi:MAG: OmpA family protein [Acidimicrobiales bacterium]|nr:OmpA family protein [Acidimicrobiales bacterium]|tara:strand:+ start:1960 stop:2838 length:879 start_codon:yes stop_codon:yes gene_type:complete